MLRPADLSDDDSEGEVDSWAFDDSDDCYEDSPTVEDYLYLWKKPNTYVLVPKFKELIAEHPNGILFSDLPDVFYRKFREKLDWNNFGYKSLEELLTVYTDIITCIKKGINSDEWLIFDANLPHPDRPQSPTDEYWSIQEPDESNFTSKPTVDWPIPTPDESNFTSKPTVDWPIPTPDESKFTSKPTVDWPIPIPDESDVVPKPGLYRPIPRSNESNFTSKPTVDWPIPIPEEFDPPPKPGIYRPIPRSNESSSTQKQGAYRPIPRPNESNFTSKPTVDWPIPIPEESDPPPKPGLYRPNPRSNESNSTQKQSAYRPIPRSNESNFTPKPTASRPMPKPDESNFSPKPTASRPTPIPDESNFSPKPTASRPMPKPDESNFSPKPTASRPMPKPNESKPIPHPDKTERSSHPDVDSPKPSSRIDSQFIDAVAEEITTRLFPPGSDFWNSMTLRPIPVPALRENTIRTENSENKSSHSRKNGHLRFKKAKDAKPTQPPNNAAGGPSTEHSSSTPASTSNPQKLTLNQCRVCHSRPENGVFVHEHIGHIHGCYYCAKQNWHQNGDCPVCSRKVYTVVELFF